MKLLAIMLILVSQLAQAKSTFDKKTFEEAVKEIQGSTYYNLTDDEIYQASLEGVLRLLESKNKLEKFENGFSEDANRLLPPRSAKEMQKEMDGEVSGIGVNIRFEPEKGIKYPIVIDLIKGGAAEKAGLQLGDQIIKVNGKSISQFKTFSDIVFQIRGKSGTKVKMSLLRDGSLLTKTVTRKNITWDAVEVAEKSGGTVIKVNFFNEKTIPAFERALQSVKNKKRTSFVLDLRNNTGGLFDEGLKAIKLFAKKRQTVLVAKFANDKVKKFQAEEEGLASTLKPIILVSSRTKSMGEALAFTLKSLTGAQIIGEKSYGKGTMESMISLKNDHSLKFTVGRLFDANDKTWDQVGITPDIPLPQADRFADQDPQLELAKALIQDRS